MNSNNNNNNNNNPAKDRVPPHSASESNQRCSKKNSSSKDPSSKENNDNVNDSNTNNLFNRTSFVSLPGIGLSNGKSSRRVANNRTRSSVMDKLKDRLTSRNNNNNNYVAAVATSSSLLIDGTRSNNNNVAAAVTSRPINNNNNNNVAAAAVASSSLLAPRLVNNNNNVAAAAVASGSVKNNIIIPPGVSIFRSGEGRHIPLFILSKPPSEDSPLHVIAALATSHSNDDGLLPTVSSDPTRRSVSERSPTMVRSWLFHIGKLTSREIH